MSRRIVGRRRSDEEQKPSVEPTHSPPQDPLKLGVERLGRKWTLLILRDLAFLKLNRFGQLLKNNPGLTPRVLARRLREMEAEGMIRRSTEGATIRYDLTPRGEDAVFILLAFLRYGGRHFAARVPGGSDRAAAARRASETRQTT